MIDKGPSWTDGDAVTKTLPDHEKCATHEAYSLTCEELEGLLAECGRRCQICGIPSGETPAGKLFIDHDYLHGKWAVRGLLCVGCNNRLGHDTRFRPEVAGYLENAWYIRVLAEQGITPQIPDEPPVGSRVRDGFGMYWTRQRDGLWRSDWRSCRSRALHWCSIYRERGGAHRLTVVKYGDPVVEAELHVEDPASLAELLRQELTEPVRKALARLLLDDAPAEGAPS